MTVNKNTVIIGDVSKADNIGSNSVVITNPLALQPGTALGIGAKACEHMVAIGDYAVAICEECQ